jgi:hypothetical protein
VGGSPGKFLVQDGVVTTQHLNVINSLDVHGSAVIEDSLTIGSGFALTPEGMTIDTAHHQGPLLELRSRQNLFSGSFLEINSFTSGGSTKGSGKGTGGGVSGGNTSMIRTSVNGMTTFDLQTNGHLVVNGIQMKSGGLVVSSGGVEVKSGGLHVHGGITLESGQLHLKDKTEMKLNHLILENHPKERQGEGEGMGQTSSFLEIHNYQMPYLGPIIGIHDHSHDHDEEGQGDDGMSRNSHKNYILLEATKNNQSTFRLDSHGNIFSHGTMKLKQKLIVDDGVQVNGMFSLEPYQMTASDEIILPNNKVFIEILNDHKNSKNRIYLPQPHTATPHTATPHTATPPPTLIPGQILILRNLDETSLEVISTNSYTQQQIKSFKILSHVTILFIFNGHEWLDIQSLSTSIERLTNIQEFTLQNDVNVGNFTITSGGYRMLGINKGEVLVGGIGGALKGRKGLTYSNGVLATQGFQFQSLESDVNGNKKTIS